MRPEATREYEKANAISMMFYLIGEALDTSEDSNETTVQMTDESMRRQIQRVVRLLRSELPAWNPSTVCQFSETTASMNFQRCIRRCTKPANHDGTHNFTSWSLL